jgi:hypothetical protein
MHMRGKKGQNKAILLGEKRCKCGTFAGILIIIHYKVQNREKALWKRTLRLTKPTTTTALSR